MTRPSRTAVRLTVDVGPRSGVLSWMVAALTISPQGVPDQHLLEYGTQRVDESREDALARCVRAALSAVDERA